MANTENMKASRLLWIANNPEKAKHVSSAATKKWYAANRDYALEKGRSKRNSNRIIIDKVKLLYGCLHPECTWTGGWEASMLDFHHLCAALKTKEISKLVSCSLGVLVSEINLCTLLCANCHRAVSHSGWSDDKCEAITVDVAMLEKLRDAD